MFIIQRSLPRCISDLLECINFLLLLYKHITIIYIYWLSIIYIFYFIYPFTIPSICLAVGQCPSSPLSLLNFKLSDLFLPYANDKYFKGTRNTSKFMHLCQSDLALDVPIVLRKPPSILFSVSVSLLL